MIFTVVFAYCPTWSVGMLGVWSNVMFQIRITNCSSGYSYESSFRIGSWMTFLSILVSKVSIPNFGV